MAPLRLISRRGPAGEPLRTKFERFDPSAGRPLSLLRRDPQGRRRALPDRPQAERSRGSVHPRILRPPPEAENLSAAAEYRPGLIRLLSPARTLPSREPALRRPGSCVSARIKGLQGDEM